MPRMKPVEICKGILGDDKLNEVIGTLTSPQIKAVLKEGGIKVKLPGGFVSQQKRRKLWSERILEGVETGNNDVAGELLQQWLLNHHRAMLVAYLDQLNVRHRDGETDDSFLLSCPKQAIHDGAMELLRRFDGVEVRAYLHYIAYQQRSPVFEDFAPLAVSEAADQSG